MNKQEFFEYLKTNLKSFDTNEVNEIVKYYDELIEEKREAGQSEEQAISSFGDLKVLISQITSDLVITRSTNAPKSNALRNFLIILGVCSFPVLLPLAIVIGVFGIVAIALLFSFAVTAFTLIVGLVPMVIMSLSRGADIYAILVQVGTTLIVITLLIMIVYAIKKYGYLVLNRITQFIASLVKKISKKGQKN